MESVADQPTGGHGFGAELADVSELPLKDLLSTPASVLANALRRIAAEAEVETAAIAAFNNYAE